MRVVAYTWVTSRAKKETGNKGKREVAESLRKKFASAPERKRDSRKLGKAKNITGQRIRRKPRSPSNNRR